MTKFTLASVSALALFGVAACSDSTDSTTTQSVDPSATEQPMAPATPEAVPETSPAVEPAPAEPAPAQ